MPVSKQDIVNDLTLMLMYLTSWEESKAGTTVLRARKGYEQEAIDALREEGLVEGVSSAKTVTLTDDACDQASFLVNRYIDMREDLVDSLLDMLAKRAEHPETIKLRVELDLWDEHPCWREILVPAWFTFADLHQAIQASFLWWDYHMYDFRLRTGGRDLMLINPHQGGIDAMFAPYPGKWEPTDDTSLRLGEVFPRTRKVLYSYDYGDGWEHTIRYVGKVDDYDGPLPVCVDGEGDAPPEDVGSLPGFDRFLEAIGNEDDPEHEEMVEWGDGQFYEPFSLEAVNRRIEKWATQELFDEWDERHAR